MKRQHHRAAIISEHDTLISQKLGHPAWAGQAVLCGGDLSEPTEVSEQYLLDLERKTFLELCMQRKTLERFVDHHQRESAAELMNAVRHIGCWGVPARPSAALRMSPSRFPRRLARITALRAFCFNRSREMHITLSTKPCPDSLTLREHVRKRPAMYLGNDNVVARLVSGLITECIAATDSANLSVSVEIEDNHKLQMIFSGTVDLSAFCDKILSKTASFEHANLLQSITSRFQVSHGNDTVILVNGEAQERQLPEKRASSDPLKLNIELDSDVYKWNVSNFSELSDHVELCAMLNRGLEILLRDTRRKHADQRFFSFPEGVFALYERVKEKALGKPAFEIMCDSTTGNNAYQIALGYRTDWYPPASVFSFANDVHNTGEGSLVAGVLEGLLSACRKHAKENNLSTYRISKNKLANGLILVCAVRGGDFKYGGSWKETLESDEVEAEAKKLVRDAVLDFIKSNKEKADKFLWRFDQAHITSAMLKDLKS